MRNYFNCIFQSNPEGKDPKAAAGHFKQGYGKLKNYYHVKRKKVDIPEQTDPLFRSKLTPRSECHSGILPVFFSSMLSGQRALDRGSYERLKWVMAVGETVEKKDN